jgi:ATP-dependent helicase HrpB
MEGGEGSEGAIHMAAALNPDDIRQLFADAIVRQRSVSWNRAEGRVVSREEERLGALVLSAVQVVPAAEELRDALFHGVVEAGLASLTWTEQAEQFLARARFIGSLEHADDWPNLDGIHLAETLSEWLGPWLSGVRSLADLERVDLLPPLKGLFSREQLNRIESGAPTVLTVPSGSRISLRYTALEPPVLEVKLQELFGLAETPTVAWGRVPVLLHLLSPARRPVQVTSDLRGFWNGAYREVRKELKGRYPKHPWPEDPWTAPPTRHTIRKR